jgi:amino acid transporter
MPGRSSDKLSWNGVFSMAVGGMVGGGIFSVLGVVIELSGAFAWAAFLLAGVVALITAWAYATLCAHWKAGGGLYEYLRRLDHAGSAGTAAWILIMGYVLTVAVYAFTFGHYLAHVLGLGDPWPRMFAVLIVAAIAFVNLRGVGDSQRVEEVTVWAKLVILAGLAGIGLFRFDPANLTPDSGGSGLVGVVLGAASVFMAYEGFQLIAYDYDDIHDPDQTIRSALPIAVLTVIVAYIAVALGAASLVTAQRIIDDKEVALAAAGQAAAGTAGLIVITVAAVFSTASAINATLFATARLARDVAGNGQLPGRLAKQNGAGVPAAAIVGLGVAASVLAVVGGLSRLVEAASLVFLVTFAAVCGIAWLQRTAARWIVGTGFLLAAACAVTITVRLLLTAPLTLGALAVVVALAAVGRPLMERHG